MPLIDKPVEYSAGTGLAKSGLHGIMGAAAYGIAGLIPGLSPATRLEVAGVVFMGLEFLRNLLKQKKPSLFFWL